MWSVFFVFLSYLDRNVVKGDFLSRALDAEKESKETFSMLHGTVCAKMSMVGENFFYQVSDGAEVVRSVVTPAGKLVNCFVTVNQMQVKSFVQECRLGLKEQRAGQQLETRFARMDEAKLMCRELKERTAEKEQVLKRSKRGFTYPGTLWCGAGNMADNYNQLGEFAATDSCCRIHDHCPHVIHAFSSKYGHTNFKWHSICHCDCDNSLKACLRKVNDTSSRVVGQAFFNVIGVPCFDFVYEEQCVERHWYGLCKRYEKLPIAVLRDSVPYDFGGIDVIDELTVAPPKNIDSKKSDKKEKTESATQSTMFPEEPSLRNVVTAAEDFIKVLATVSTSQSSTTESDRGEAQSSEKKKRKKKKKITKKQKEKGKGRKRKQKSEAGVKIEEGAAVSPSGSKSEKVKALRNYISESHGQDQSSRNTNRVGDNEYELGGKDEPSNEVMKDEPAMEKEVVSITPRSTVQKSPAESDIDVLSKEITPSTSTVAPRKARRPQKGRRKKSKKTPLASSEELPANTTGNLSAVSVPTVIIITPMAQPGQQSFSSDTQKRPVVSAASTPIVIPKVKRNRSKEREDREGRKKRRKGSSTSPIVSVVQHNSSVNNLKVIPRAAAPTILPIPTTERQISHRPNVYGGKIQVTPLSSSLSVLKRQRLKDRGLRNRRRKTVVSPPSENRLFSYVSSQNVLLVLTTPDTPVVKNSPASTAAMVQTHSEWKLFATAAPTISTKRHQQAARRHKNPRKEAAALSDAASVPKQTQSVTFTTTPFNAALTKEFISEKPCETASTAPTMNPLQRSIEKVKVQFSRKKRRKARLTNRQQ